MSCTVRGRHTNKAVEQQTALDATKHLLKFSSRNEALQNKTKTSRNVLPFITTFNPATPNLKKILMKHWHLITESNRLGQIYSEPPIVAYRKDKSLKDLLVRAEIPSHI